MAQMISSESVAHPPERDFAQLAKEFYDPIFFFIARQINHREDAADLTQQVFLRGYQSFDRFDPSREFAPWIYTIARRVLADHFRSRKVQQEPVAETIADARPHPDEAADASDNADRVWELAAQLKPNQHQILLLHYKEDFNVREAAEIMGISTTHAKVLLFRARNALRQRLESHSIHGGNPS